MLASANALNWRWHHSSLPIDGTEGKVLKDGTEGMEAGAEGDSSSFISPCCPKLIGL